MWTLATKMVPWQADQGPHHWPQDLLEVPDHPARLAYDRPKRSRCTEPERPGRKRVYCQNPTSRKEDGSQPWTWVERSQDLNSFTNKRRHTRSAATHKGLGMSGVCIRCATERPEGAKEAAAREVAIKQYKLYKKDKGGPPDYPWLYHEPCNDLRSHV